MIDKLYGKDTKESYKDFCELEILTTESDSLYKYFDEYLKMLDSDISYIRIRGFRLISCHAKWDKDNKINNNINKILNILNDSKPTNVRQALRYLNNILLYKPVLNDIIKNRILDINLDQFKDTMRPLIEKDIKNIINNL